jgi:hypothetical protein
MSARRRARVRPPADPRLSAMICRVCGHRGVAIVAFIRRPEWTDEEMRCWCEPACASEEGWPFLIPRVG